MTHTNCPHCRAALAAAQTQAGLQFCPACGGSFTQGGDAAPVAKPAAAAASGPRVAKTLMWTGGPIPGVTKQQPTSSPNATRIADGPAPITGSLSSPFAAPNPMAPVAPVVPAPNPFPAPSMTPGSMAAFGSAQTAYRPTTAAPTGIEVDMGMDAEVKPAPAERAPSPAARSTPAARAPRKPTPAPARPVPVRGRTKKDEDEDEDDQNDADEPRKGKGALVAVIIIVILLLGGGVAAYLFFGTGAKKPVKPAPKPSKSLTADEPPPPPPPPVVDEPAPRPVAEKPAPRPVAEKPAPRPVAERPAPRPVAERPVAERSEIDERGSEQAFMRGNAKLRENALPEAIAAFNEALRLNPNNASSHRGLGMAYAQSGKAALAVKHFKAYLKDAPNASDRALIERRINQLQ